MTIKQLEYFMAVARLLNFSEAAKQLFISQPALSRSISTLEEELGVILFFRSRHSVALTPAGMVLSAQVPRLRAELDKAIGLVQQAYEGVRGKLHFQTLNGLSLPDVLVSAFDYFRKSLPYLELHLNCIDTPDFHGGLEEGTTDVVYSFFTDAELRELTRYASATLAVEPAFAAVSAAGFRGKSPASLSDFRGMDFIFVGSEASPLVSGWKAACSAQGFLPRIRIAQNVSTQLLWLEQGYGVGLFPEKHRVFESPFVRRVPLEETYPIRKCLLWNPSNPNPSVDLFIKLIRGDL